jgi:hypothetical protein
MKWQGESLHVIIVDAPLQMLKLIIRNDVRMSVPVNNRLFYGKG